MAGKPSDFMLKALHPYWRFAYTKIAFKEKGRADPFANLKDCPDREHLVVVRGKKCALTLNKFPYMAGHLLAIPYRKVGKIELLTADEMDELMRLVVLGKLLVQKVLNAEGVNIGLNQGTHNVGGGSVPSHLHWHVVPRWVGDHNFFPTTTGARILLVSQEKVWRLMRKEYARGDYPHFK